MAHREGWDSSMLEKPLSKSRDVKMDGTTFQDSGAQAFFQRAVDEYMW
jgi:hypothetical protein